MFYFIFHIQTVEIESRIRIPILDRLCSKKRQALFIVSMFIAKPVFVNRVFTVKPVFVNSLVLWVFQNNFKFSNFLSIWRLILYSVRSIKYFSLEILKYNCDFVGPFNLKISCIKVKIWVLNFWGCYTMRAAL